MEEQKKGRELWKQKNRRAEEDQKAVEAKEWKSSTRAQSCRNRRMEEQKKSRELWEQNKRRAEEDQKAVEAI